MGPLDRAEDERLVLALRAGDRDAFARLFDRWYDRVHELARRITRDDGLAADVAQDAFLAAWQRLDGLDDPAAFGGWLLRIARNRALDVVRAPARARTQVDGDVSLAVDEQAVAERVTALDDPAEVVGDREVQDLVWSAAATLGERDLTALDLSLRHGMEPAEIGEVLGINRNAANQLVHRMKGRLATAVGSRVLWRGGAPACPALREALAADGLDEFDARAVRVADRHARSCEDCTRRRDTRLAPAHLFAALPVAAAPVLLKAKVAAALEAAGVPAGAGDTGGDPGDPGDPGAGDPGGDAPGDGAPPDGAPRARRRRRVARAGVALVVVVVVLAVVAIEQLDRGDDVETVAAPSSTAEGTTAPTTTEEGSPVTIVLTTSPPGAPADAAPADEPAPDLAPGGGGPAAPPPPPPPPAPTGSIAVSPGTVPDVHVASEGATVSWSSSGGTAVSVSGNGLSSSAASGAQQVCPGTITSSLCQTTPGTYTYVLTVTGPGGTTQRSATLTVA